MPASSGRWHSRCPRQAEVTAPPIVSESDRLVGNAETEDTASGPANVAVLPFENKTGDPELNWLRSTFSATMAARLKKTMGWSTADGSFVREMMAVEEMGSVSKLSKDQAIGLSGVLFAKTIVAGGFEGEENSLTVTAAHYSGDTGELLRSTRRTVAYNNRTALIDQLVEDLTAAGEPVTVSSVGAINSNGETAAPRPLGPIGRTRNRVRVDRPALRLPALFQMETPDQVEQAIRLYRRALELNPNYADAHFTLGYAFDRQGDMDKALASYRQAVTLEPLNADYLFLLGYTYERNRDMAAAVDAYDKALTSKPDDSDIAFSLGYANEQQ